MSEVWFVGPDVFLLQPPDLAHDEGAAGGGNSAYTNANANGVLTLPLRVVDGKTVGLDGGLLWTRPSWATYKYVRTMPR